MPDPLSIRIRMDKAGKEMDKAQKELDKCPFCGCSTIWIFQDYNYESFKAVCFECSAQIHRDTLTELVEAWNRRPNDA